MKVKNDYLKLDIQRFADGEITYKVSLDGNEAERTISNLSKSSDTLSKKFTSFGTKMTVGVTAPLTALATAGVKYNATMESYLANLTTLLGGNQQEAQKLLDTLKEMANTTPYEATDLVKATQKMMAFGISAEDSLKYLNMLGDIAMGDANKMDSLTLAFSQISASGRASMEDINQMIDQGFNPLTIIAQKTGESMADLRDRVSAGGVSFEEIAGAFETATSKGGTFYQSMDKASQTTEGKISTLKDGFNTALGSMTESLLPFVTESVEGLTKVADWFANLDENGKRTVLTLAGIALAIGPITSAIGGLIKTGSGIKEIIKTIKRWQLATKLQTAATKAMAVAQKALNLVMNANPMVLIVTAIMAVVAGLVLLYNKFEWFRNAVDKVFSFVIGIVQGVIDFFKNNWQTILLFILNPFAGIFKILYDKFEGFRNFVNGVVEAIKNFFVGLFNKIVELLQWPVQFVTNVFLLIVALVATFLETVYNYIVSGVTAVYNFFSTIANWIYNNVLLPVYNFFASIFTAIYNTVVNFINMVISVFSTIASWIYNNVLMPIYNFFASIFNTIWGVIQNVINNVKNAFQSAANFIKNAFTTVKNTVMSIFNAIATTVKNVFNSVVNVIKSPINGLISVFNKVIKGLNKIKMPDWVPAIGGKGINIPLIPKLATGTNYVAGEGLAYLHEGEAVVPKKYNPAIGGYGNYNQPIYVTVNADMDVNKFGKAFVRDIKTFSGGTKNSYNYGGGK
mgnify:CR=1 FL=1